MKYQQKIIEIREVVLNPKHFDLAASYHNIALTYGLLGKYENALKYQLRAVSIFEEILDSEHQDLALNYTNTGYIYRALGQYEKALKYQLKSVAILETVSEPKRLRLANSYHGIADAYIRPAQKVILLFMRFSAPSVIFPILFFL